MSTENKRRKIEDSFLSSTINRLNADFYNVSSEILAKNLLGKILMRKLSDGTLLKGIIVETECYPGGEDKASHSYNGRRTSACEAMYMDPGTTYVYFTYGMYHCFNISSNGPGSAVLLRAVDPLTGFDVMQKYRKTEKRRKPLKHHELCNGPSKLCISFNINKTECNKKDLCTSNELWIENNVDPTVEDITIVTSTRIGIDSVEEEWSKKPFRFYVLGNMCVSKRDKVVESIIMERINTE